MDHKSDIENKVAEALNSLEGIGRASAGPYFYTRVKAHLDNGLRSKWERIGSFLSRPAIALSVVFIILLANLFVLVKHISPAASGNNVSTEQSMENAYDLASNTNNTILTILDREDE
jgi:hypothetical protein